MDTHSMIFVAIGNLVSLPNFSFAVQVKGAYRPAPSKRKISPFSAGRESRAAKQSGLLSRSSDLRNEMFTHMWYVN
jgi:hypothetical protein